MIETLPDLPYKSISEHVHKGSARIGFEVADLQELEPIINMLFPQEMVMCLSTFIHLEPPQLLTDKDKGQNPQITPIFPAYFEFDHINTARMQVVWWTLFNGQYMLCEAVVKNHYPHFTWTVEKGFDHGNLYIKRDDFSPKGFKSVLEVRKIGGGHNHPKTRRVLFDPKASFADVLKLETK